MNKPILFVTGLSGAARCQALSKRSRMQCKKAALKQKRVCMFHGGKSTGPITKEGRKRCAIAKTVHGYETRAARKYRAEKFRELKALFDRGLMSGKRIAGRKPTGDKRYGN